MDIKTRSLNSNDYERLKEIHEKFYKDEFTLPDFIKNYLLGFVVEENGSIVTIGGIRTIVEVVLVTDKSQSVRVRRDSLLEALRVAVLTAKSNKFDQIHAFIQDPEWKNHLEKIGFHETKGTALVLEIEPTK